METIITSQQNSEGLPVSAGEENAKIAKVFGLAVESPGKRSDCATSRRSGHSYLSRAERKDVKFEAKDLSFHLGGERPL